MFKKKSMYLSKVCIYENIELICQYYFQYCREGIHPSDLKNGSVVT